MWLVLLDRSDSMGRPFEGNGGFAGRSRESTATVKLEAAKQAIVEHLRGFGAPTRVVLIAFHNDAEMLYDGPSDAQQAIEAALEPIRAGGATRTAAALNLAGECVDAAGDERLFRALVVTDGEDDLATTEAAAKALSDRGVVIDVTLIDPTPKGEAVARAIARYGAVSAVTTARQLSDEVGKAKVAQEVQHAAVDAVVARHEDQRARLDTEKPAAERLAFTAAYPAEVAPDRWHSLLVYLHLAALQDEVARLIAEQTDTPLPRVARTRAQRALARGALLTLTPRVEGLDFNPPAATLAWVEDIQDIRFRFRAAPDMSQQSVFGAIEVTLGSLPIAHLGIAINVHGDAGAATAQVAPPAQLAQAKVYQDVFASYSSLDAAVVQACRAVYWGLGIHLAVDKATLRSGQDWDPALRAIIDKCDLFQLFWSVAASRSLPVRNEYEFALRQIPAKGVGFIRPMVWETPSPQIPPALQRFHFAPLDLAALAKVSGKPLAASPGAATETPPRVATPIPVAAFPLVPGASPDVVRRVREDLAEAVRFLEGTTGLRYYPVPTLLVDEHVVRTVRSVETVDLGLVESDWADCAGALEAFLLAMNLQFHVGGLVAGERSHVSRDEYAARFGAGTVVSPEQFEWLRGAAEGFPRIADALGADARKAMRRLAQLRAQPQLDLDLAELVALTLDVCASAVEDDDPRRTTSASDRDRETGLDVDLVRAFVQRGGAVPGGRGLHLLGPAGAFAALLRAIGARLAPLLLAVQRHDPLRSEPPPPEAAAAAELCALAALLLRELLQWSHPLRKDFDFARLDRWLADLLDPIWHSMREALPAQGLGGPGPIDTMGEVLRAFLDPLVRMLEAGLRAGGDFDLDLSFGIAESAWKRLEKEFPNLTLTAARRSNDRGETTVALTGRFSAFVDLYRSASTRLSSLVASAPRRRSSKQRVFVEMSPTFGIFAPAASDFADQALYRWAGEQGIAQALTLPGADRVLLCLGAADRFTTHLRDTTGDPAQAQRVGDTFQRCVLVHEHFHSIVACGLDDAAGPAAGVASSATPSKAQSSHQALAGHASSAASSQARSLNEALAAWMELHYVRGDGELEALVWDYIRAGTYPAWPYAGAACIEAQHAAGGLDAVRGWIARLRTKPELAQADFDRACGIAPPAR